MGYTYSQSVRNAVCVCVCGLIAIRHQWFGYRCHRSLPLLLLCIVARAPSPRVRWAVCMQTTNGGWLREATHNGRRPKKKKTEQHQQHEQQKEEEKKNPRDNWWKALSTVSFKKQAVNIHVFRSIIIVMALSFATPHWLHFQSSGQPTVNTTTTLRHYNVKCVSNGVGRSMQSQTRVITISQYNDDNMIRYYIL